VTGSDRAALPSYAVAGVDEQLEQSVFARAMRPWLSKTAVRSPMVTAITGLASGYFATIMHIPPGPPLALTTDGVGTKILLARIAGNYEGIGVDCVANNVNDLICVGAVPLALLDYLAIDRIEEAVLEQLARGLYRGAAEAGIAIPGGEIAQIGAMLAAADASGPMLDLVGTAIGALPATADGWRQPIDGSAVGVGDVIVGLPSSGLHSNGYSLVRHLVGSGALELAGSIQPDGPTVLEMLLVPTRVYVSAMDRLWAAGVTPKGLVHISGGGLLNLGRLAADVSYVLDRLPEPPAVFRRIQEAGRLSNAEIFATLNMGIGFCVVVAEEDEDVARSVLSEPDFPATSIGRVTEGPGKRVAVPDRQIIGSGDTFAAS
jgi:phosphoribosylformylglycinamidine cyclo-ligase